VIHPAANEASLRHLAARLNRAELELAQAVGNLSLKDLRLAEQAARIADLERQLGDPKNRAKNKRST
jgi:hypothetical protein